VWVHGLHIEEPPVPAEGCKAVAMANRSVKVTQVDVAIGEVPADAVGSLVAQNLAVKGFCVLNPGFDDAALERAQGDTKELDFYQVNAHVADGLLGPEGSSLVADLDSDLDDEARKEGENLRAMDHAMTRMGYILEPYFDDIGLNITHRSAAVLHQTGQAEEETPCLTELEVSKWQSQFIRHKLMAVIFLGPMTGSLELQPFGALDAEPYEVKTPPGTLVILRPDWMSHRHSAPGANFAISSFYMADVLGRWAPDGGYILTPAAKAIDDWTLQRLRSLKEMEDFGKPSWDPEVPEGWRKAMNHSFRKGQQSGLGGVAMHSASTYDPDAWFQSTSAAVDFAVEVPVERWNHQDHYDPDPDSWMRGKTSCRHGCFMEGAELFDNKFFNLSPNEARGLDPHQRCLLEQGYNALAHMGRTKKNLMNSPVGVYVGCGTDDWLFRQDSGRLGGFSGNFCMYSGRFAFCLGCKGPAITVMNDSASGLTAIKLGAESVQKKGLAVSNDAAVAVGVHLMLAPMFWSGHSMKGWLATEGRCLTFNSSAGGYIRGDGCSAVALRGATKIVDGKVTVDEKDSFLGIVSGVCQTFNGRQASMSTPHGPSQQEALVQAVSNCGISPLDVDCIEAFGSGNFLGDAVEIMALWRGLRGETEQLPLCFTATKSSMGNQIECGGVASFMRIIFSGQWGHVTPNLHLRQVNPHLELFEEPIMIVTECLSLPYRSCYSGAMTQGYGGTNICCMGWATMDSEKVPRPPPRQRQELLFWPGGGGELEADMMPRRSDTYCIAGTWSRWEEVVRMKPEGNGQYSYAVTLGENKWEQFQIWLDGDPNRVLHPGGPKMPQGSPVLGPDTEVTGGGEAALSGSAPTWLVDGRRPPTDGHSLPLALKGLTHAGATEAEAFQEEEGQPGDQYRVVLHVSGRWRMVTWERMNMRSSVPVPTGTYYVACSWDDWELRELQQDPSDPSRFSTEVRMMVDVGEFQVLRNRDWNQVFYPNPYTETNDVLGPDDGGEGRTWCIDGRAGDRFSIEFRRSFKDGQEQRQVYFEHRGNEPLSIAERWARAS